MRTDARAGPALSGDANPTNLAVASAGGGFARWIARPSNLDTYPELVRERSPDRPRLQTGFGAALNLVEAEQRTPTTTSRHHAGR